MRESEIYDDIQFLSELQKELNTQETDGQAAPIFWVVRQYEKRITDSDFSEGTLYFHNDGDNTDFETLEELQEYADYHLTEKEDSELYQLIKTGEDIESIFEEILDDYNEDGYFNSYSYVKDGVIKENTMFLTKQEAQDHINNNRHHYNKTVHTYAMTAWRAPKVARLLNILSKFDFGKLLKKENNMGDN